MPYSLTKPPRLSNQDVISGHPEMGTSNDRGFHPSVFSPWAYEDAIEPTTGFFPESYETTRAVNPAPPPEDDACASQRGWGERSPVEVFRCPFGDCNFSYNINRTQHAALEWKDSWKHHVYNVHWPVGSRNWQVCQLNRCGIPQRCRNTAWKHLAVHVRNFRVECPIVTCTSSFSRGDRLSQHMRQKHAEQGPE